MNTPESWVELPGKWPSFLCRTVTAGGTRDGAHASFVLSKISWTILATENACAGEHRLRLSAGMNPCFARGHPASFEVNHGVTIELYDQYWLPTISWKSNFVIIECLESSLPHLIQPEICPYISIHGTIKYYNGSVNLKRMVCGSWLNCLKRSGSCGRNF